MCLCVRRRACAGGHAASYREGGHAQLPKDAVMSPRSTSDFPSSPAVPARPHGSLFCVWSALETYPRQQPELTLSLTRAQLGSGLWGLQTIWVICL